MDTDKMREEFEAWYLAEYYEGDKQCGLEWLSTEPCGGYRYAEPAKAWRVWQASRAALVIELPPQVTAEDVREAVPFDADGDYAQDAAHMVNGAISACGSFAKAAGVTVRG